MASFIMAGRWQAIVFSSLFALLAVLMPPFAFLSNAAVALVTLRQGVQQGMIVAFAASIFLALATLVITADLLGGFVSGLQQWLPMVFLAMLLSRTVSWTYTLQAILLLVIGGLLLFHISVAEPQQFWKESIEQLVNLFLKDQPLKTAEIAEITQLLSTWATAIIAVGLLATWIISLLIARYWQAGLYHVGGFGEEFRELRLGKWPAILVLLSVSVYSFTHSPVMADISLVGMSLFLFHGLGLMHGLVKKMQMHQAWLVSMYILMIPIFPSSMIIFIVLVSFGIIDSFADFRNTLTAKKD